jgi:Zn-dependent protease
VFKKVSPVFLGLLVSFIVSGIYAASIPSVAAQTANFRQSTDTDIAEGISIFLFVVLGWLVSTCLHEFGHAWVAYRGGDIAIRGRGYLTLDPLKYMDPITSIGIPLLMLVIGGFALPGAAVYVNRNSIRTKRLRSLMSLAGPAANLVCFMVCVLGSLATAHSGTALFYGFVVLAAFQIMAVLLNLLPIPGLDGWGAALPWLPRKIASFGQRYQSRIFWLFIFVLIFPGTSPDLFGLANNISGLFGISNFSTAVGFDLFRFWS